MIKKKSIPFDAWLSHINVPVIIIQNSEDPLGPYGALKRYVNEQNNIKLIESIGDSHNYNDLDMIKRTVRI
jgi:predicted alpha/beta-fold hydrolase